MEVANFCAAMNTLIDQDVCHCMEVSCGIIKTSREWTLCISPGENVFDAYLTSRVTHTVIITGALKIAYANHPSATGQN